MNSDQEGFDLERYLKVAGATRPEAFDWSVAGPPLEGEALFCLGYMMDIESHTIDASITSFLSCWAYEEFFHSKVLRRLLEAHGVTVQDEHFAQLRRRKASDHLQMGIARVLARITRHFCAVHMTWGAINEWSTLIGYRALIARSENPLVARVLKRIIKDERRHYAFYFNQARNRLRPRAAQILTSLIVRKFWSPVGSPVRGDAAAARVCSYLFSDAEGARQIGLLDSAIARLPSLGWFDLGKSLIKAPQPYLS